MIIAALIIITIIGVNYSPNTFLSIWDTIHTEFNFALDIKRNFFSIWQEYRGLGLVDGMAHAADLPRQILLYPFQYILPISSVRFFYHFLMLALGFAGTFSFIYFYVLRKTNDSQRKIASLAGSLFYLLNFGTIQYFLVPFESFSSFWGMFPWLMFIFLNALKNPSKKNYFILAAINLLAAPAFYIHTIFIVYILVLSVIILVDTVLSYDIKKISNAMKILLIVIAVQSFWLLPAVYFFKHDAVYPRQAHINYMSSQNTYLQNKRRGTLADFLILRGYYYDFVEENGYMMETWRQHFNQIDAGNAVYLLAIIGLAGILLKNPVRKYLLPVYLISALTFLSDTWPVDSLQTWIRSAFPFWDQVFRSPFTKFIVPASFSLSVFFATAIGGIFDFIKRLYGWRGRIYQSIFIGILLSVFIFHAYPVFQGKLFSASAKIRIPLEYFQLFSFFNKQNPNERIALFPQQTYWGWMFYSWGYRGSGIVWQGIPQPVLDRAFDVWNKNNENYYWEISYALYSRNRTLFEQIIRKYQIKWIIIDGNVVSFASSKVPFFEKTENLLKGSEFISLAATFGKIKVYKINEINPFNNFIAVGSNIPQISPIYNWNQYDRAYQEYGNYMTSDSLKFGEGKASIYYPFRSLFTSRKQDELEFNIVLQDDDIEFSAKIPKFVSGTRLFLPKFNDEDIFEVDSNDLAIPQKRFPEIYLNDSLIQTGENSVDKEINLSESEESILKIRVPKIYGLFSYENIGSGDLDNSRAYDCDKLRRGHLNNTLVKEYGEKYLRITTLNTNGCLNYELDVLSHKFAYLLTVNHRNIKGNPLLIGINNQSSTRADQETILPEGKTKENDFQTSLFIIPPMEEYARGYTIRFENDSIGKVETVNDIGKLTVNPIPYRLITGIKLINGINNRLSRFIDPETIEVIHPNPNIYEIKIRDEEFLQDKNRILILSQSFHPGWQAYRINCQSESVFCRIKQFLPPLFFPKLKNHMLINNWENGWLLDEELVDKVKFGDYIIIFTPQYIQYLGYGLTVLTVMVVFMGSLIKKSNDEH